MQHLKDKISSNNAKLVAINVDLQKGQEALETFIATINANVNKEMHTQAEMAKYVKAQSKHVLKEIKVNTHWMEVVKKQN